MNIVLIIPTGIGCEIGGHAGDANPTVKLVSSVCDILITNPNAVNASDINEMPDNVWYVEGSMLNKVLSGVNSLYRDTKPNKILLAVNPPVNIHTINSVNAARATLGADIDILELKTPLTAVATKLDDGSASGDITGFHELIYQTSEYDFDALAIQTAIDVPKDTALDYRDNGGVNPWGGAEAKLSKMIANRINCPVAHAPFAPDNGAFEDVIDTVVDPCLAAEFVSVSYLHCVLKGLHRAPKPNQHRGLGYADIDFMITPHGCWGEPHEACQKFNIPIIVVRENKTIYSDRNCIQFYHDKDVIMVNNYLEAVGVIQAYKSGIKLESLKRPLRKAVIYK